MSYIVNKIYISIDEPEGLIGIYREIAASLTFPIQALIKQRKRIE